MLRSCHSTTIDARGWAEESTGELDSASDYSCNGKDFSRTLDLVDPARL